MPTPSRALRSVPLHILAVTAIAALPAVATAQDVPLIITERDPATAALTLRGIAVDRGGSIETFRQSELGTVGVTDYATTTTIPFEGSVLGVPQVFGAAPVAAPAPGERAGTVTDALLNSSLQNPSVTTGLQLATGGLVNGPGVDFVIFEASPPPGVVPPSGGPTVLGGDPVLVTDMAGGGSVAIFADGYEQFGGDGFTGPSSFFTTAGEPIASLDELEAGDLDFIISVPGLNLYGTAVDLSDLGVADGATVTDVQLNSIAATGFGPDIAFAGAIPVAGSGTFAATVGGVTVIDLDAIGPFTEDFVLEAASPTGALPDTIAFDAPLFTTLSFAETPFGSTAIAGDFLLDGSVELSPNSEVVADYLTGQIAAGSLSDANVESLDLISLTELDVGLSALSPEPFAAAGVSTVVSHTESITNILTDRFDRAADEMGIEDPRFITWGNVYGIFADVDSIGDDVFSGYDGDGYGFVSGIDARVLPGLRLGLFTGYADSDVDFDRLDAGADVESYHIGGYGTLAFDRVNISSWVAYAFGDVETRRNAGLVGLPDATADYDADQFIASTEISYRYPFRESAWVEPQLRAVYIHVDGDSFTESGAPGLALDVETENINVFLLEPELRVGTEYEAFGLNFMPEVTIGYSVDVIDEKNSATARLVGAGPETFTVAGVPRDDNAFLASAGVTTAITPRITTFLHYDGRFGEDGTDHGVKGGLQFSF